MIHMIFEKDIKLSDKIILFDLNHMMIMIYLIAIGIETPRIDGGYSLEKELTELICMNP